MPNSTVLIVESRRWIAAMQGQAKTAKAAEARNKGKDIRGVPLSPQVTPAPGAPELREVYTILSVFTLKFDKNNPLSATVFMRMTLDQVLIETYFTNQD